MNNGSQDDKKSDDFDPWDSGGVFDDNDQSSDDELSDGEEVDQDDLEVTEVTKISSPQDAVSFVPKKKEGHISKSELKLFLRDVFSPIISVDDLQKKFSSNEAPQNEVYYNILEYRQHSEQKHFSDKKTAAYVVYTERKLEDKSKIVLFAKPKEVAALREKNRDILYQIARDFVNSYFANRSVADNKIHVNSGNEDLLVMLEVYKQECANDKSMAFDIIYNPSCKLPSKDKIESEIDKRNLFDAKDDDLDQDPEDNYFTISN